MKITILQTMPSILLFGFIVTAASLPMAAASKLCAVSRQDKRIDVLWIDGKGAVWNAWWEEGQNQNQWNAPVLVAPEGTAEAEGSIAAVSRTKDHLDIFWTGKGGAVLTAGWSVQSNAWSTPRLIAGPGSASITGGITVVSRLPEHLDVFWITPQGNVMSNWWNANLNAGYWNTPFKLATDGAAAITSSIAAISRFSDHLDVFWVASDGAVLSNWWNRQLNSGQWNAPFKIANANAASTTGGIAALSRNADHAELYWVAPDGSISESWWARTYNNGIWNPPFAIAPAGNARPNSSIAAIARRTDHADVFWVAPDGSVCSTWWNQNMNNAQWNAPFVIAGANSITPGNGVVASSRFPEHLDAFWLSRNEQLYSAWWMSAVNNASWNAPFQVTAKPRIDRSSTTRIRISDALSNTYRGKDGRIGKSVSPAAQGTQPKASGPRLDGAAQEIVENDFVCTITPVSENNQPFENIVLTNPTELFYPGAVLDAKSIADGSYQLQSPDYAPMHLTINLLGATATGSTTTVIQPEGGKIYRGKVFDGITKLLQQTAAVGNAANASIDFRQTESEEELEMFLGGSFSGWGASVSADMSMSKQQKRNVIYVKYIQKDFSVIVDSPPSELLSQHTFGQYPNWCMVQKVNYGRMVIVRFETNYSAEELSASIEGSYGGFGFGAKVGFNLDTRKVLEETTASAVFIGGDPRTAGEAISSLLSKSAKEVLDKLKNYIVSGAVINKSISVVPISYELVFLDGSRAMIQTTTNYVNRECRPLARHLDFTFEGLMAFDDIYDKFNSGNSGYNFYTGYQDNRHNPLTLSIYYTDAPRSRRPLALVTSQVIWNANADQSILVLSSASNTFKPDLRTPFEELKGAPPRLTPFGDPKRGGGIFVPQVRISVDPEKLRNDQVLLRLEGQVSREMTFDDEAMYLSPATASEYLLSEIFQKRFVLEYKHNNSEHRCLLQFSLIPLY